MTASEAAGPLTPRIRMFMEVFNLNERCNISHSPPLSSCSKKNIIYIKQWLTGERAHTSPLIAFLSALSMLWLRLPTVFPLQILRIRQRYSKWSRG